MPFLAVPGTVSHNWGIRSAGQFECDATCNLFERVPQRFGQILLLRSCKKDDLLLHALPTLASPLVGSHSSIPSILLSRLFRLPQPQATLPSFRDTTPPQQFQQPKMDEEPTLPTLPDAPWSTTAPQGLSSLTRPGRPRKLPRGFASPAYTDSSDPPVFSSDDSPALDNYGGDSRRKRRYVGSWFDQQPVLSSDASMDSGMGGEEETKMLRPAKRRWAPSMEPRGPRKLKRQLDSGVWLARGDFSSTDTEELGEPEMKPGPAKLVLTGPALSVEEQEARRLVRRCQEEGNESVDLKYVSTSSPSCCELTRCVAVLST